MKQAIVMTLVFFAACINANADSHLGVTECQTPINHVNELPNVISNTIPKDDGVESFITLPLVGEPKAIIFVTTPIWYFQCLSVEQVNESMKGGKSSTSRKLLFWAKVDDVWVKSDSIDNQNVVWPLDTYGNVTVSLIRDGDTTFRLEQHSGFQRTSFADTLSFKYDNHDKFRINSWDSNSRYLGMYGGGPEDTDEGFEAKQKTNPDISDFDGYEGEVDYGKKTGWVTKYKFEESPVKRSIAIVTEPTTLSNLRKPFMLASFDCSKATTRIELAICSSKNLSNLDSNLDDIFRKVKQEYDSGKRSDLVAEQRHWLKERESICFIKDNSDGQVNVEKCLSKVYSARYKELSKMLEVQRQVIR